MIVHRLVATPTMPAVDTTLESPFPNVIVRFVNRKTAFKLLKHKKNLKNTLHKNYFITENLCPYNKQIFNKLYKLKNTF